MSKVKKTVLQVAKQIAKNQGSTIAEREKKLRKRLEFFNMKSWVELPSQNDLLRALEDAMELVEDMNESQEEEAQ